MRISGQYQGDKSIVLTGRPSNIAIVKHVAEYLVQTCDGLAKSEAKKAAQALADDGVVLNVRAWAASFRIGFGSRIMARAGEEIAKAKAGDIRDEATGTALVLAPLYDREAKAISEHVRRTVGQAWSQFNRFVGSQPQRLRLRAGCCGPSQHERQCY